MREAALIRPMSDAYRDFLHDESKQEGTAESISFPRSVDEVREILTKAGKIPVTCQGARTGLDGLAVPHGGHVMNFSEMNQVLSVSTVSDKEALAVVEPGVTLLQLRQEICRILRNERFFWPPSPTEETATVGGIALTGAYGMNSHHYGATEQYVSGLAYISADGRMVTLSRRNPEEEAALKAFLKMEKKPPVTELVLRLVREPETIWSTAFFFPAEEGALACADALQRFDAATDAAWIASMEYLDRAALDLAEAGRGYSNTLRAVPSVPQGTQAMIILEIEGAQESVEEILYDLMELVASHGSDPDTAWALVGSSEVKKLLDFRHAVTEEAVRRAGAAHAADARIGRCGGRIRICTDGTEAARFSAAMQTLRMQLADAHLTAAVCTHIGEADFDVSVLPADYEEYCRGRQLTQRWKDETVRVIYE